MDNLIYDDMVKKYAEIQRFGFRIKFVCIKCGASFDVDDLNLALPHKINCDMINKNNDFRSKNENNI